VRNVVAAQNWSSSTGRNKRTAGRESGTYPDEKERS